MSGVDLRVAISDKCDLSAIRALRDIVRDSSRLPRVAATTTADFLSKAEMSWTRTDSPKREAALTISMKSSGGVRVGGREKAHAMASLILERAFEDSLTTDDLVGWHRDLREIAIHAALLDVMGPDRPASLSDGCSAIAATPWRAAVATRHRVAPREWDVITMAEDGIARHLPHLPMIVLIREASHGRRGVINVGITPLRGGGDYRNLDPIARLRAMERFS